MSRKVFLVIAALLVISCTITHKFGPYDGKVVDAETGEPIEGAAVLGVFYFDRLGPASPASRYVGSRETVTDRNGEFHIPATRFNSFRLLAVWVYDGHFYIFKPGYAGYNCFRYNEGASPKFLPGATL